MGEGGIREGTAGEGGIREGRAEEGGAGIWGTPEVFTQWKIVQL